MNTIRFIRNGLNQKKFFRRSIRERRYLKPLGLSQNKLAEALGVDSRRINEIVAGPRSITGDTALRLARYFGTSPEFWMNLQARYDLEVAKDKKLDEIQRKVKPRLATQKEVAA
jgi:antitoxin HigA-1